MKKQIVLIDGENTVHKIVESLLDAKLIQSREGIVRYKLRKLIEEIVGTSNESSLSLQYFTAKVREAQVKKLKKKTDVMIAWNARWAPWLSNQGIQYVKSGNLQIRDTKKCTHCGRTSLVLQEKGVDVRIATEILLHAKPGAEIFVVSSDSDLVPAIKAARSRGALVTYVGFEFAMNVALVACSSKTRVLTKNSIISAHSPKEVE